MASLTRIVEEFHRAYDFPINLKPHPPQPLPDGKYFRVEMLREEVQELEDALRAGDMLEVLDALTDIQYFLAGAYLEYGLQMAALPAFMEVHRSNMSKLGEDGKPIKNEQGKALKGPNYFKPDLAKIMRLVYGED